MQITDADGRQTRYGSQNDPGGGVTAGVTSADNGRERVVGYNSTSTARVLRTQPAPFDYDVFALPPAGSRMPPPPSVSLAFNESQLLALLQVIICVAAMHCGLCLSKSGIFSWRKWKLGRAMADATRAPRGSPRAKGAADWIC